MRIQEACVVFFVAAQEVESSAVVGYQVVLAEAEGASYHLDVNQDFCTVKAPKVHAQSSCCDPVNFQKHSCYLLLHHTPCTCPAYVSIQDRR